MAERLAPVTVLAPVTSRPEQSGGSRWRWPRRLVVTTVVLALALAGTVATAHFLSIERHAHEIRATSLVPLGMPARVLVVVARPGQELPMAGTLATLHDAGTAVSLLSLTADPQAVPAAGEPGTGKPPGDVAVPPALLAEASTVGLDSVAAAGFQPGELLAVDPASVIARIRQAISDEKPSAVVTVGDSTGGDPDSQAVAGYTMLAAAEPSAGVARVWTVSRGAWERNWLALTGSPLVDRTAPTPQVAVRIMGDIAGVKAHAMAGYAEAGAGDAVIARYPGWDRVPATMYVRFWDREYFALAWGTPVD